MLRLVPRTQPQPRPLEVAEVQQLLEFAEASIERNVEIGDAVLLQALCLEWEGLQAVAAAARSVLDSRYDQDQWFTWRVHGERLEALGRSLAEQAGPACLVRAR